MTNKTHTIALLETALAIGLWAVSFTYIKIALQEVSPVTLIIVRYSMGAGILGLFSAVRGDFRSLSWRDIPGLALLGAVGVALQQLLQVSGQVYADAGVAAFLASTAPAFLVILAAIFLRERLSFWQLSGVFLATFGAGVVSTGGDWQAFLQGRLENPGNLLVLLSAVVWAVYSILTRFVVRGRPSSLVAFGMMIWGLVFVSPLFIAQSGWRELSGLTPQIWGALLYVGVMSTALAYLLYSHALKHAPASRLAAIQNIEPVLAVIAAVIILNEALTWWLFAGGAAILGGLFLAEKHAPALAPPVLTEKL
jgi:drug/metabolite transporter (DMT)-like permease